MIEVTVTQHENPEKSSVTVSLDAGNEHIMQITFWDTGEAEAEWANLTTGARDRKHFGD